MVVHIFHRPAAPFSRTLIPRSLPLLVPIHGFLQRFREPSSAKTRTSLLTTRRWMDSPL
jgi:hypothetical protein